MYRYQQHFFGQSKMRKRETFIDVGWKWSIFSSYKCRLVTISLCGLANHTHIINATNKWIDLVLFNFANWPFFVIWCVRGNRASFNTHAIGVRDGKRDGIACEAWNTFDLCLSMERCSFNHSDFLNRAAKDAYHTLTHPYFLSSFNRNYFVKPFFATWTHSTHEETNSFFFIQCQPKFLDWHFQMYFIV